MKPIENKARKRRRSLHLRGGEAPTASTNGRKRQPAWAATTLVVNERKPRLPKIVQITDGVYSADGYAFSNLFFVVTNRSVVVIDTTESLAAARAALGDFRKIIALPISHLIYTHYHADHTGAAKAFCGPETKVIGQQLLPQQIARKHLLLPYRRRVTENHFAAAPGTGRPIAPEQSERNYIPPDITFDDRHSFEEGGVVFELLHAPGETPDHTFVWLPQKRVLFPADLYYGPVSDAQQPDETRPPGRRVGRINRAHARAAGGASRAVALLGGPRRR